MNLNEITERANAAAAVMDHTALNSAVEEAVQFAATLDGTPKQKLHANITHWRGLSGLLASEYHVAEELLTRSVEQFKELDDESSTANALCNLGSVYKETGQFEPALDNYQKALAIFERVSDVPGIARTTGNIGSVHYASGDYPSALERYYKSLALYESLGNKQKTAMYKANIGMLYVECNDHEIGLEWLEQALEYYREIAFKKGIAHITGIVAGVYWKLQDEDTAIEWMRHGLALAKECQMHREVTYFTSSLCTFLVVKGELEEAWSLIDKHFDDSINYPTVRANFLRLKGGLFNRQGNREEAIKHLEEGLRITVESEIREVQAEIHESFLNVYKTTGPLEKYVAHNEEYWRLEEQLRGEKQRRRIQFSTVERKVSEERREAEQHRVLLHNVMPEHIANRIIKGETLIADEIDDVAVYFIDIVEFTELASKISPGPLLHLLNAVFNTCDRIVRKHGLMKIKTIGDAYLAISDVNNQNRAEKAAAAALCALEMHQALEDLHVAMPIEITDPSWLKSLNHMQVRMGLNIGPVVAGVVGTDRVAYDVWGDTVNVASRMEQTCEPGMIQISDAFAKALPDIGRPEADEDETIITKWKHGKLRLRGSVKVKGKGDVKTWWLEQ